MKIICSTNMPFAEEAFGTIGDVVVLHPSEITPLAVRDADLLCVRSTTRVNRALLEGSKVRFVGTATIGTDHMDIEYMETAGITWCSASGCNANSASEYVTAALLSMAQRHDFRFQNKTLGVIGVGRVGRLVVQKAETLGLRVLQNDPPRSEAEDSSCFLPLEAVLAQSDIITLHVPLNKGGRHPTFHLANASFFRMLKPGCQFINAARGAVVESDVLLEAMKKGVVAGATLDTWEGEPDFRSDILELADIGTPHIAGHSFDGKVMGTVMVFREACRFLGVDCSWCVEPLLPEPTVPEVNFDAKGMSDEAVIHEIVQAVYDIESDDRRLREAAVEDKALKIKKFEQLRQKYQIRREFRFTVVNLKNGDEKLAKKLTELGFRLSQTSKDE